MEAAATSTAARATTVQGRALVARMASTRHLATTPQRQHADARFMELEAETEHRRARECKHKAAEAELRAAAQCAQGLVLAWRAMACLGLPAELPVAAEVGSKEAAGLCSSWPAGGRARRASAGQRFLRGLKEAGMLRALRKAGAGMASGMLTKSAPKDISERHGSKLYGEDKYYKQFAASKAKKDAAAFAGNLPPPEKEKAPKSFIKSKKNKKGSRSTKIAKKGLSKGECLSAHAQDAAGPTS